MKNINLYAFGRCTVNGAWDFDRSRVLNRLYYVNSGCAVIHNGTNEYQLTVGKFYIIPQCKAFHPIDATDFDHTYFDFYSSKIFCPNKIIEFDGDVLRASSFFEHINSFVNNNENIKPIMEEYLSGFLSLIESKYKELYYISESSLTYALNIIPEEYASITTDSLAKRVNLNKSYFIRLFSSAMGLSPMKYIRAVRVSHGKELIQNGESISNAAELCGYSSPSAFYNAVKSELGVSPSDFKNKH